MKPLWGAWQSVYTFTRERVSSSALLHSDSDLAVLRYLFSKGVLWVVGKCVRARVSLWLVMCTTERPLKTYLCGTVSGFFGKFLCTFQWILCVLTSPHPTILGCPYPLSLSWDVSGGGNPVVAPIVISIVFHWIVGYSPLYIESRLTLFPPWAEGHDTDTTIWHAADE